MPPEQSRRDRLGERARQRRHVDDVDPVPHAVLAEERIGEECELQRSDRALDRHVDDVDDKPATVEVPQRLGQRSRAVKGVEVVDAAAPLAAEHPGSLVGPRAASGCDDQVVVADDIPVREQHGLPVRINRRDLTDQQLDPLSEQAPAWFEQVAPDRLRTG